MWLPIAMIIFCYVAIYNVIMRRKKDLLYYVILGVVSFFAAYLVVKFNL